MLREDVPDSTNGHQRADTEVHKSAAIPSLLAIAPSLNVDRGYAR